MGLTLVDSEMIQSLDWAWRACRPQIQKGAADRGQNVLPANRLVPRLMADRTQVKWVRQLSGGSAGGLVACAMYAAAAGAHLNTAASASVALKLRDEAQRQADLDIADILVAKVSDESVGPKLRAAKRRLARRLSGGAGRAAGRPGPAGLRAVVPGPRRRRAKRAGARRGRVGPWTRPRGPDP